MQILHNGYYQAKVDTGSPSIVHLGLDRKGTGMHCANILLAGNGGSEISYGRTRKTIKNYSSGLSRQAPAASSRKSDRASLAINPIRLGEDVTESWFIQLDGNKVFVRVKRTIEKRIFVTDDALFKLSVENSNRFHTSFLSPLGNSQRTSPNDGSLWKKKTGRDKNYHTEAGKWLPKSLIGGWCDIPSYPRGFNAFRMYVNSSHDVCYILRADNSSGANTFLIGMAQNNYYDAKNDTLTGHWLNPGTVASEMILELRENPPGQCLMLDSGDREIDAALNMLYGTHVMAINQWSVDIPTETPLGLTVAGNSFFGGQDLIMTQGWYSELYTFAEGLLSENISLSDRHAEYLDHIAKYCFQSNKLSLEYPPGYGMNNPSFVTAVYYHYVKTGDKDWLAKILPSCIKAVSYLFERDIDNDGLYEAEQTGLPYSCTMTNWNDCCFCGHKDSYSNVFWYKALQQMSEITTVFGMHKESEQYRNAAQRLSDAFNKYMWNESNDMYVSWIDVKGGVHDFAFTHPNLMAIDFGMATEERARKILKRIDSDPNSYRSFALPYNLLPISTEYYSSHAPGHNEFGFYLNGGVFPNVTKWDVCARAKTGDVKGALAVLKRTLARYMLRGGRFWEGANAWTLDGIALGFEDGLAEYAMPVVGFYEGILGCDPHVDSLHVNPLIPNVSFAVPYLGKTVRVRTEKNGEKDIFYLEGDGAITLWRTDKKQYQKYTIKETDLKTKSSKQSEVVSAKEGAIRIPLQLHSPQKVRVEITAVNH